MQDCIFCKIVAKEIPNYTVYEDAQTLAFLDIHPRSKGHAVVIPKVHAETTADLNEELLKHLLPAVQKTREILDTALSPDAFSIGWNDGKAAGQVVPHLHIHIMPRWDGDGGGNQHTIIDNPGDQSVEEIAALFA